MTKSPRPNENKIIDKRVLIRTYREFKEYPDKIFVCRDFGTLSKFREKYLNTLISLGIIEEVDVFYTCGRKMKARRDAKGYKLSSQTTGDKKK